MITTFKLSKMNYSEMPVYSKRLLYYATLLISSSTMHYVICLECGSIKNPMWLHEHDNSVIIPFYPNLSFPDFSNGFLYDQTYRWIKNNNDPIILKSTDVKYSIRGNMSLVIHNVSKSDEGRYSVQCNTNDSKHPYTVLSLDNLINAETEPTTAPKPTSSLSPSSSPSSSPQLSTFVVMTTNDSLVGAGPEGVPFSITMSGTHITLIVVAVCALFIAIIAALLVMARRRQTGHEGTENLVKRDHGKSKESASGEPGINGNGFEHRYVSMTSSSGRNSASCHPESEYALIDENLMYARSDTCKTARSLEKGVLLITEGVTHEGVAYSNAGEIKTKKNSYHGTELNYATLDHEVSGTSASVNSVPVVDTAEKLTKEYAVIDFTRSGFVAPIRKAPSSWYKRKNKQTQ